MCFEWHCSHHSKRDRNLWKARSPAGGFPNTPMFDALIVYTHQKNNIRICLASMLKNCAVKKGLPLVFLISIFCQLKAQKVNCVFKQPSVTIDFGTGEISDLNTTALDDYSRVQRFCPTDGHYAYTDYTSDCFRGDWQTLEDHTPGDGPGNMLLVNSSYRPGIFFQTTITGLKSNTIYEFGVWMMNVC